MSWTSAKGETEPAWPPAPAATAIESVGALLDRLAGEPVVDDVVQRDPAVGVHRRVDVLARAERGDDDRRLPLDRQRQVLLEPRVRLVHDLVDGEGRGGAIGMGAVMRGERLGDLVQPFVELRDRARVQRREGADDPGLALGDHQRRMRDDEQRRADDRQAELVPSMFGSAIESPRVLSFTCKPIRAGPARCAFRGEECGPRAPHGQGSLLPRSKSAVPANFPVFRPQRRFPSTS